MGKKKCVIVIGEDHHNTLGVIRSLGEEYYVILYIYGIQKSFVSKSRYVDKFVMLKELDDHVVDAINEEATGKQVILIPTSDKASSFIDLNLDLFHSNVRFPSISSKSGKINYYMDKVHMTELFHAFEITTPKNFILREEDYLLETENNKSIENLLQKIELPVILKPVKSVDGDKMDIKTAMNVQELKLRLEELFGTYDSLIIEEYVEKKYEIGLLGYRTCGETVIPRMIIKEREGPVDSGSSTFGRLTSVDMEMNQLKSLLDYLDYDGIFDIEYLVDKHENLHLIEINFRNGGNSYAFTQDGYNLIKGWIEGIKEFEIENRSDSYFMLTHRDMKYHLMPGNIRLKQWLKDFLYSIKLFLSISDPLPFIFFIAKKIKSTPN